MKRRVLAAALAVVLGLLPAGCANTPAGGGSASNGSIAITRDDALLYAADADRDSVFIVEVKGERTLAEVKVGKQPEKVLMAPDDTVYVTNRLDRSVSVLRRGETKEAARVAVGVEPVGLAISSDGKTLYVVNSTSLSSAEVGTVMAFDTGTLTLKWELPVGHEPRGITLLGDGRAAVTLFKDGDVVFVDLDKQAVQPRAGTDVYTQLNRMALGITNNAPNQPPTPFGVGAGMTTSHPRGVEAITTSADGQQVYATTLLASDIVLQTQPGSTSAPSPGSGYGSGSCGSTAIASPGLLTFAADGTPSVDDLGTCSSDTSERPATQLVSGEPGMPVQGPRAMVADPTGAFLFIANFNSNNVGIVPTATRNSQASGSPLVKFGGGTLRQLVHVGAGPTGIAMAHDGKRAWVFNAFDHSISRLEAVNNRVSNVSTLVLGADVLPADVVEGRKLFFSASDERMNNPSMGIACGTCHLEGREDGNVWNFADGPRQTPSLAGRMLSKTAPFHWNGEFNDLLTFMSQVVPGRMGGTGVTPTMERQLAAFLDAQPAADNPHRTGTPADVVARGRAAFEKAACSTCHTGEAYTDNSFADVGTFATGGRAPDNVSLLPHGALNTPSLLGLARTAPYLHDGSALTLKARILQGKAGNKHGATGQLTDAEVDDLVSYLETL
jgi:YVTN family beta-propeller protein